MTGSKGLIGSLALGLLAFSADAANLVEHRATYSMNLSGSSGSGAVGGARGAMVYEFRDTCDGWAVKTQVYMRLQYARGPEIENVRTLSSWEAKDGSGFRFKVSEKTADQVTQEISGVAVRDKDGGIAEFTQPKSTTLKLPANTVFPTEHLNQLIETGLAGGSHLDKVLFDGATLENPYVVGAAVRPRTPSADDPKVAGSTPATLHARMAYFPAKSPTETPEFELGVDYGADGVVRRVLQDFGDYAIEAQLTQFEELPKANCEPRAAPATPR